MNISPWTTDRVEGGVLVSLSLARGKKQEQEGGQHFSLPCVVCIYTQSHTNLTRLGSTAMPWLLHYLCIPAHPFSMWAPVFPLTLALTLISCPQDGPA